MTSEELPPEPQLVESMRAVGYSIETAVADIVDNSIAADSTNIRLLFKGLPKPQILILDDGSGMSKDELRTAMKLAGKSPSSTRTKTDLGRFGLGLKTASFSQAKRLTVISKGRDGQINAACWDLDLIEDQNKWLLQWVNPNNLDYEFLEDLNKQKSGTLVVWEKLDQVSLAQTNFDAELRSQALRVSDHIGLVFHRFIEAVGSSKVSFSVNSKVVEAIDPFFSKLQATQIKPMTKVELQNGTIEVTPYILPHISQLSKADAKAVESMRQKFKDSQGFYVYRNRRLISYGSWFRLSPKTELSKMARVKVDTPNTLDRDWKLGIMKSSVEPPQELRRVLSNLVPNIVGDSRKVVTRKGSKLMSDGLSAWQFREVGPRLFSLEVNRDHPLLVSLASQMSASQISLFNLVIGQIETGLPMGELISRFSTDHAQGSPAIDNDELFASTSLLLNSLLKVMPVLDDAIQALYKLEPFASDPFSRDKLDKWKEQLRDEVRVAE